jgi:hypothetical protein
VTKQRPLEDKEAYIRECALVAKKKGHNLADCPNEDASKQVCQNQTIRLSKPEYSVSAENFRTSGQ